MNGWGVGAHDFPDGYRWIRSQQFGDWQTAQILVTAVHNDERVCGCRQVPAQTQIPQYQFCCMSRSHCNSVRVHQTASTVFGIGKHRLNSVPIPAIQILQYLIGNGGGQLLQDIGKIVGIQVFGHSDQLRRIHGLKELGTNIILQVLETLVFNFFVQQAPDDTAGVRGVGFDDVGQFAGTQGREQNLYFASAAPADAFQGLFKLLLVWCHMSSNS